MKEVLQPLDEDLDNDGVIPSVLVVPEQDEVISSEDEADAEDEPATEQPSAE